MKFLYKIILIIFLILSINKGFAIEKSSINLEQNPSIKNTIKNIEQAKLIENEVIKFRNKLLKIQKKYKLENDSNINKSLKDLYEIIYILRKIQTTKVNKNTADYVIKVVINDLKKINYKTKSYLKTIKNKLEKIKEKYSKLSNEISIILDKIIYSFINYYTKKKNLNSKDKKIIKVLSHINKLSFQLKNINKNNFYSQKEMQDFLIKILKQIKQDFQEIKKISKKR